MKPFTSFQELDALGEGLSKDYIARTHRWNVRCFDIEGFITDYLGLAIVYESFAEKDSSKIGFLSNGIDPLLVYRNGTATLVVFPKDTIVIERFLLRPDESSRKRFTLAHEAAHKVMERHVPMQKAYFHSEYDAEANYSEEDFRRIFSMNENLINRLGAAIIMLGFLVAKALKRYNNSQKLRCYQGMILAPDDKMNAQKKADSLGVSCSALLNRLKELSLLDIHPLSEYISSGLQFGGAL